MDVADQGWSDSRGHVNGLPTTWKAVGRRFDPAPGHHLLPA